MTDLNLPEILARHQRAVELVARVTEAPADTWRVVLSDSESPDAVVPACANPLHAANAAELDTSPEDLLLDGCCPYYVIETRHEPVADFVAAAFTDVPALAAEVERLRTELANTQPSTLAETLRDAVRALDAHTAEEAERIAAPLIKEADDLARATIANEQERRNDLIAKTRREIEVQERHVDRAKAEAAKSRAEAQRLGDLLHEALAEVDAVTGARFLTEQYRARIAKDAITIEWQYGVRIHYVDDGPMDLAWSTEQKARAQIADLTAEGSRVELLRRREGGEWEVVDVTGGVL